MEKRTIPLTIEKASGNDFDARFVLSAATPDRVRDTIDPKAYTKAVKGVDKLIALFNHDSDKIVGYWSDLKAVKDTLTGSIKFFNKDWGSMVKEMLDFGIPLGASIGFQGKGEYQEDGGINFKDIELLETSIVAVPAHPRAQQIAKSYGLDLSSLEIDEVDIPSATSGTDYEPSQVIKNAKAAVLRANQTMRQRK